MAQLIIMSVSVSALTLALIVYHDWWSASRPER
jgi:hypothetical protein